jgi:hypothetical protein
MLAARGHRGDKEQMSSGVRAGLSVIAIAAPIALYAACGRPPRPTSTTPPTPGSAAILPSPAQAEVVTRDEAAAAIQPTPVAPLVTEQGTPAATPPQVAPPPASASVQAPAPPVPTSSAKRPTTPKVWD